MKKKKLFNKPQQVEYKRARHSLKFSKALKLKISNSLGYNLTSAK